MAADRVTVVQMSDLHLDPAHEPTMQRMCELRDRINDLVPLAVIATGDLSSDGHLPGKGHMFPAIRDLLNTFHAPVHTVPGNHDVGNKAGLTDSVSDMAVAYWRDFFADRFAVEIGSWRLLGLNSQILNSESPLEHEQRHWLRSQLADAAGAGQYVGVFAHMPLFLLRDDEKLGAAAAYFPIDPPARDELLDMLRSPNVRFIASGHLHNHQIIGRTPTFIWCPAMAFVLDYARLPREGMVTGFLEYTLDSDGQFDVKLHEAEAFRDPIRVRFPAVELPGEPKRMFTELLLDFTGTLSRDGELLPGVAERLETLADHIRITVLTADTFGTADAALADLPVNVRHVETGKEKATIVEALGAAHVIAIGNGRNDVAQVEAAGVGIAVIGPEGCSGELLRVADVVTTSIHDALDLVLDPLRLKATLRR